MYTRTGDKGTTSLYTGAREAKDHPIFEALGDVDELNAAIGLAREFCLAAGVPIDEQLEEAQSRLMDVGTAIATPISDDTPDTKRRVAAFPAGQAPRLEAWIDTMDAELPPLRNFILPSGGAAASQLHVARTVCRRAERSVVPLARAGSCPADVAIYLNRLSDALFVAARFAALRQGRSEVVYRKARDDTTINTTASDDQTASTPTATP